MKQLFILILAFFIGLPAIKANGTGLSHQQRSTGSIETDSIEEFWSWFSKNEKRLRLFESDPDRYLTEISDKIKVIETGLAIELAPPVKDIIDMTITADGNINLFSLVRRIVEKAPVIDGWKFIALRQRLTPGQLKEMHLTVKGLELNPSAMRFFPVVDADSIDLIIYTKGITEENYISIAYAGLMLLDNILGEYDCVMKVRNYDFHPMPIHREELDNTYPLLELPDYIDRFYASKEIRE